MVSSGCSVFCNGWFYIHYAQIVVVFCVFFPLSKYKEIFLKKDAGGCGLTLQFWKSPIQKPVFKSRFRPDPGCLVKCVLAEPISGPGVFYKLILMFIFFSVYGYIYTLAHILNGVLSSSLASSAELTVTLLLPGHEPPLTGFRSRDLAGNWATDPALFF